MLSFRLYCSVAAALLLLPFHALPAQSSSGPDGAIAQMQTVEDAWGDAVAKRDQYGLENVLAADFVGISAEGDITTRNQQIAHLFAAGAEPLSLSQKVINVRVMGDVAIVNGTYVMEWPGTTGQQKVAEKGVFTHIFRKNGTGRWLCINSQRTVVATEEERKKKKAEAGRKSNAALPLHIPLVYKGPESTQTAPKPDQPQ